MKTKILIFGIVFLLLMKSYYIVSSHPITRFIMDGREKVIMYWNITPRIVHIDIECIKPQILWEDQPYETYENMNIFFFPQDFTLMYTAGHRYVKLKDT